MQKMTRDENLQEFQKLFRQIYGREMSDLEFYGVYSMTSEEFAEYFENLKHMKE